MKQPSRPVNVVVKYYGRIAEHSERLCRHSELHNRTSILSRLCYLLHNYTYHKLSTLSDVKYYMEISFSVLCSTNADNNSGPVQARSSYQILCQHQIAPKNLNNR